jgi:hypothetical protein
MKITKEINITDVKIHSRLHIYSFVGSDVKATHNDNYGPKDMRRVASVFGDLEVLQYLTEITDDTLALESSSGSHKERWKEPWDKIGDILGRNQHWKCLKWLVGKKYSNHEFIIRGAIRGGADLEMLKWLHSMDCKVTEGTFVFAAYYIGNIEILQWLRVIGCPWNALTFRAAVETGKSMDILIWLRKEGCPWSAKVFDMAVRLKDKSISLWLRVEGCPWDSRTFTTAVSVTEKVDLWVFKWLHNEKCPWDKNTFIAAVKRGDMDILKWLHEKQCPWDAECIHAAIKEKNIKVVEWLRKQGCPSNETTLDLLIQHFASNHEIME